MNLDGIDRRTLVERIASIASEARKRWPSVVLDRERFLHHLERIAPEEEDGDVLAWLASRHMIEVQPGRCLSRTRRCCVGRARTRVLSKIERRVLRLDGPETYDRVRNAIVSFYPKQPSLLLGYAGRSSLSTWLTGVAKPKALELGRSRERFGERLSSASEPPEGA